MKFRLLWSLSIIVLSPGLNYAQSITNVCGQSWAAKIGHEIATVQKAEKVKDSFQNRAAKILPLSFYRVADDDFASSGYDTTLLGQILARSFGAALDKYFASTNELSDVWEVLPPIENSIFQSQYVFIRPDSYLKESEENRRRLMELQPDFLLCGEYEITTIGINLLEVKLQRVAHPGNPFPKQSLTLWNGKLEVPFISSYQFSECKSKDIRPFDLRPYKELMDDFSGQTLGPIVLLRMDIKEDRTFSVDTLFGDLRVGSYYKMQISLSKALYVYAFSFERFDSDKRYLYLINGYQGAPSQFRAGKTIFPFFNSGVGFTIKDEFEDGYPVYFKVFALEDPVFIVSKDQKKEGDSISYLSPEMAKRFLDQVKLQVSRGKKVYTAELTKFLDR